MCSHIDIWTLNRYLYLYSDQLAAEHAYVKYADGRVIILLSLLLNACIIHGFLPVGLMESVIVPIVKNARENISSKDNYRPIAL